MASRNFNRFQALEKEVKSLYLDFTVDSSADVATSKKLGITSITHTGTGEYTIVLDDIYTRLMHIDFALIAAADEDLTFQVISETVTTTKTIVFHTLTGGTATDPADADRILVKIDLKNSSAGE